MAITKYESYYTKICENLNTLKDENDYENLSAAFAHWYLQNYYHMDPQEIGEAILDGGDDLGIDSVVIDEDSQALIVMQYKFPSKKETIGNEISQGDILKTLNGFKTLISNDIHYKGNNTKFAEFKKQLEDTVITHFKICFVSYNKGVVANKHIVESEAEKFRNDTGSYLEIVYHDRNSIADIYEKINRKNNVTITLKYNQMQSAYNVKERSIDSMVGFVNGKELIKAISDKIATIFDENIRLFEYGSSVNSGINRTATSSDQADMFYFYNNGVVFICDEVQNSPASSEIILRGASVVNGCQTLSTLYNADQKGKLSDSVYLLVRIISIADYSERMRITEFLNSQTPIKDSYFIANHPIVRDLQDELREKGFFLERQINEYSYMKEHGVDIVQNKVLQLEKALQYYVGYWINNDASLAKRGKSALFDKNKTEELLSGVTADKVIEAYQVYNSISRVLTLYRKVRRNSKNEEFATFLGATQEYLRTHIEEFRFMNTGDIILLNAYRNIQAKYSELGVNNDNIDKLIIDAIAVVKEVMDVQENDNYSLLTKNASVFKSVQAEIRKLSEKIEPEWINEINK